MTTTKENAPDPSKGNEVLALSIEPRKLGEFIANLLGQRRCVSRRFNVVFEVSWNWLYNLDDLIVQRIEHQNEGQLVSFSAKLFFENGKVSELSSRSDFRAFRDISDVKTAGIEINWAFIVKFPTARTPEKQEIRLVAKTQELQNLEKRTKSKIPFFDELKMLDEEFLVEIFYSNVTWGDDLMNLIATQISNSFAKRSMAILNLLNLFTKFAPLLCIFIFILLVTKITIEGYNPVEESFRKGWENLSLSHQVGIELIDKKLNYVYYDRGVRAARVPYGPFFLAIIPSLVILGILAVIEYVFPKSFILLNEYTVLRRESYHRQRNFFIGGLVLAFIMGTLSSIFAGQIAAYMGW